MSIKKDDKDRVDHSKHRQRLKKRFIEEGLDGFEAHNKLELLLFYAIPQGDTNPLSHRLLDEFGSLSGAMDAPYEALLNTKGIGDHSAILLKLIPSMCRAYFEDLVSDIRVAKDSAVAAAYLMPKFIGLKTEHLYMLALDNRCVIKKCCLISEGGTTYADVDTRKVLSEVINCHATTVILAHNHPFGVASPSEADKDVTGKISDLLAQINVTLADHIIFSGNESFAMSRNKKYQEKYFTLKSHGERVAQPGDVVYNAGDEKETVDG